MEGSNIEGQEIINQELSQLGNEWESLQSLSDETLKSLSDCCSAWQEFHEVYERMKKWLQDFHSKLEKENANVHDTSETRLNRCRELLKDADNQKSWMEDVNDRYLHFIPCSFIISGKFEQLILGNIPILQSMKSIRIQKILLTYNEDLQVDFN